jgi:hypothetical protein
VRASVRGENPASDSGLVLAGRLVASNVLAPASTPCVQGQNATTPLTVGNRSEASFGYTAIVTYRSQWSAGVGSECPP